MLLKSIASQYTHTTSKNALTSYISNFSGAINLNMQTIQKQQALITSSTKDGLWHYFASIDNANNGTVSAGFCITLNNKTYTTNYDYSTKQINKTSEFGTWLHYVLQREGFSGGNVDDSNHGGLVIFNTAPFQIKLKANFTELEDVLNLKHFYYGHMNIKNIR